MVLDVGIAVRHVWAMVSWLLSLILTYFSYCSSAGLVLVWNSALSCIKHWCLLKLLIWLCGPMSQLVYKTDTKTAPTATSNTTTTRSAPFLSMKLFDAPKSTDESKSSWWPPTMVPDFFNFPSKSDSSCYLAGGLILQSAKDHLMGPGGIYQCGFSAQCQMKMQQASTELTGTTSRLSSSCPSNLAQPTSLAHFDFESTLTQPSVEVNQQGASLMNRVLGLGHLYNLWPTTPSNTMTVNAELSRPASRHLRSASFSTPPKTASSASSYFPSLVNGNGVGEETFEESGLKKSRVTVSTSTIPTATSDGPIELMDLLCHQKRLDLLALVLKMASLLCQVMPRDRRSYSEPTLNELVSRLKMDLNQCQFCEPKSTCLTNLEQFKEFLFGSTIGKNQEQRAKGDSHEEKVEKFERTVDEQLQRDRQRRKRNKTRKKNRRKRRAKNQSGSNSTGKSSDVSSSSSTTVTSDDDDEDSYESFEGKFFACADSDSEVDDLEYEQSSSCFVADEDDDLKIVFSDDVPESEVVDEKNESATKKKSYPCPLSICKGMFLSNLFPSKEDRERKTSLPACISLGQGSNTENVQTDSNATMAALPRRRKVASLVTPQITICDDSELIKSPVDNGIPIPKSYEFEDSYDYSPNVSSGSSASPEFPLTEEEIARNLANLKEEADIKQRTQLEVAEANRKWNEAMELEDLSSEDEIDCCNVFTLETDGSATVNTRRSLVTFSPETPIIHLVPSMMSNWDPDPELEDWSLVARDRMRLEDTISRILTPTHRDRIYRDRFQ